MNGSVREILLSECLTEFVLYSALTICCERVTASLLHLIKSLGPHPLEWPTPQASQDCLFEHEQHPAACVSAGMYASTKFEVPVHSCVCVSLKECTQDLVLPERHPSLETHATCRPSERYCNSLVAISRAIVRLCQAPVELVVFMGLIHCSINRKSNVPSGLCS